MPNAVIIKSVQTIANKRLRKLGQDRLLNGGSVALFDLKSALYPAQDSSFAGIKEGVAGSSVTFNAGNSGAPAFAGGLAQYPTSTVASPGFGLRTYASGAGIDLAEHAGSTSYLFVGWFKFIKESGSSNAPLFTIAQAGASFSSPTAQLQFALSYAGSVGTGYGNLRAFVAGQVVLFGYAFTINTIYQVAVRVDLNPTTGITTVTLYVGTNGAAPVKAGSYSLPYTAFAALTSGGIAIGAPIVGPAGVGAIQGVGVGRAYFEDLSYSLRDPERQLMLDYQLNAGRFS